MTTDSKGRELYTIEVAGITRHLPLLEIAPGVRIAVMNILGDTELIQAAAKALALRLPANGEVLVAAEAKSIPLAHALSVESGLPYVVLRKSYKTYMGEAISAETRSITTAAPQTLYLDERDLATIHGHRVILVDDVISTGSTLQGMRLIMDKAGAEVVADLAVFTEGDRDKWADVIALGHLPLFLS